MAEKYEIETIARIYTDFPTKFGIPRQSSLAGHLKGTIVFEPEYRNPHALRGLDTYSHLWLIWQFSECEGKAWSPTVRPPRLGGNTRMGVFATRAPFRPNTIGISVVKLESIEMDEKLGPVIYVSGIDMMDGTPIFDIKPYQPYSDSIPDAKGGYSAPLQDYRLQVEIPEKLKKLLPPETLEAVVEVLAQDPRPAYQKDRDRIYGFPFAGYEIRFRVEEPVLTVCDIILSSDIR